MTYLEAEAVLEKKHQCATGWTHSANKEGSKRTGKFRIELVFLVVI
jgi:hypothetical protein